MTAHYITSEGKIYIQAHFEHIHAHAYTYTHPHKLNSVL